MNDNPQRPIDPTHHLQWDLYDYVDDVLQFMMPRPVVDTPEARALRVRAAVAAVASLAPTTLVEAELAVHHVLSLAHGGEFLHLAAQHAADPKRANRLHAQAAKMGSEGRRLHALLLHTQALRRKRDAKPATRVRKARTGQTALRLTTEALEAIPPRQPARKPTGAPVADDRHASRPIGRSDDPGRECGQIIAWPGTIVSRTIH